MFDLTALIRARLAGRDTIRRSLGNSFWLCCDQLGRMAAGLLVGVWVARYLGPEQFGLLSYAAAIIAVVSSFSSLGMNAIIVRQISRDPHASKEWLGAGFYLKTIASGLGLLVSIFFAWAKGLQNATAGLVILVTSTGIVFQVFDLLELHFQARGESRISAWVRLSACGLSTTMRIILVLCHAPIAAFAAAAVAEMAFAAIGWIWVSRYRGERLLVWAHGLSAELFKETWPLALASIAVQLQAYGDQIILGSLLEGSELGQYAAALRVVNVFAFIPIVLYTVASPEITRAKGADRQLYLRRLYNLYRMMMIVFLATAAPLILIGPDLVRLVYGFSYNRAAALIPLLSFRLFFTNFGLARGIFLTNENLVKFSLYSAVAGTCLNLGLNLAFIPRWGARGAIVASFASFAVTTFMLDAFCRETRPNLGSIARAVILPWKSFQ